MADLAVKSKSKVQVFENSEFGKVRMVMDTDGEPWFVGKDVCEVFGDTNYKRSLCRIASEERRNDIAIVDSLGRNQFPTLVNEGGLYSLLFTMQPEHGGTQNDPHVQERIQRLRTFRRWVTHEVLPSIRKHGAYVTPSLIDQMLADPDTMIRLLTELKEERAKSAALADKVEEQAIELNESKRYWTIAKYNRMNKLGWSLDVCKKASKEASRYARLHNYQIKRCETNDERFGWVNSYPLDMLKVLFKR